MKTLPSPINLLQKTKNTSYKKNLKRSQLQTEGDNQKNFKC